LPDGDWAEVEYSMTQLEAEKFLNEMQRRGSIESWEPSEPLWQPLGVIYEGSPMAAPEEVMGVDFERIGLGPIWLGMVEDGTGVTIGIADQGTPPAAALEFLQLAAWESVDGRADQWGHATACASRAAGQWGALPEARVKFAQALGGQGGTAGQIVNALKALADAGCDVISASFGGPGSPFIDEGVRYCLSKGVAVSAAAGNSGPNATIGSPARVCPYVWGATTLDGSTSTTFTSGGNNWPEETGAIPGQGVGLAHLDGGYGLGDGTSFSCPVGSAIVGALKRYGR
jgi:hypothetical protein